MRQLNGLYTKTIQPKTLESWASLPGRYPAILVDKDNYLLTLCRYVVLNPVRAKIVKDLKETGNGVLNQVFVRSGIKAESPLKAIKGQLFLGQENFIEEIKHLLRGKERLKEITRPVLNEIFKGKDQKSKDQVM
jgi:hypothetical protein